MSDAVLIVAICVMGLVTLGIVAIVHNLLIYVRANRNGGEFKTWNGPEPPPSKPKPLRKRP